MMHMYENNSIPVAVKKTIAAKNDSIASKISL